MLFARVNLTQKTKNEVSDLIRLFQHEVVAYPRKQVNPGVRDPLAQQAGVRHRDDSVARSVEDEGWPGHGCRWDADNQVFVVACNMAGKPFCGSSLIVDPRGDILAQAGVGVETIAATLESDTVAAERAREPFRLRRPSSTSRPIAWTSSSYCFGRFYGVYGTNSRRVAAESPGAGCTAVIQHDPSRARPEVAQMTFHLGAYCSSHRGCFALG